MIWLIFLATEDAWCTTYTTDNLPDFCAIQAACPAVVVWDAVACVPGRRRTG